MNPDWIRILMMVCSVANSLMMICCGILAHRKRLPRRGLLLTGALVSGILGITANLVFLIGPLLFNDFFVRIISSGFYETIGSCNVVGSLIFYSTLLMIAMDRSNQSRRIAELEAILSEREELMKSR